MEHASYLGKEVRHELVVRADGLPLDVQRVLALDETDKLRRADLLGGCRKRRRFDTQSNGEQDGMVWSVCTRWLRDLTNAVEKKKLCCASWGQQKVILVSSIGSR